LKKSEPTWTQVKAKLSAFDRPGLVALIQDLYTAHKENRTFLHTRFSLGEDVLEPYKQTIQRSISPDPGRSARILDISTAKGKQAIVDYRKAVGDPAGLAELTVFYCERAAGFCSDFGNDDESYFEALLDMFQQAVIVANTLPSSSRDELIARLDQVCIICQDFGYGVGDTMADILGKSAENDH
jgi:hypothetical protein